MIKHPKGLPFLAITALWDRFVYYGIVSVLVLYVVQNLHFTDRHAYQYYGVFTTLAFITPVIGGYLADKFLGLTWSVIVGTVCIVVGNMVMLLPRAHVPMFVGLIWIVLGIGLFKANAVTQLGLCYRRQEALRESGFTLYYMSMNLGSILGPIFFGVITLRYGWHVAFRFCSIGVLSSVFLYMSQLSYFRNLNGTPGFQVSLSIKWLLGVLIFAALFAASWLFFTHLAVFNLFTLSFVALVVLGVVWLVYRSHIAKRKHIAVFVILTVFSIIISAGEVQLGSSLTLFVKYHVHRELLGFVIPVEFFFSLEPIAVVLFSFFLSAYLRRHQKVAESSHVPYWVSLGLLLTGLAFVVFWFDAHYVPASAPYWRLWLVVAGNLLMGVGDLVSTPCLLSVIGELAPEGYKSFFMGIFWFAVALSGYVGSWVDQLSTYGQSELGIGKSTDFSKVFLVFVIISLVFYVISVFLAPTLKRWITLQA